MGKRIVVAAALATGVLVATGFAVAASGQSAKLSKCPVFMPLNPRGPLLGRNPSMRKAISWALDRRALDAQGVTPWTHLLFPGTRGAITAKRRQPYRSAPNYARARALAAGHFRDGKIIVAYRVSPTGGETGPDKDLVVHALERIGFQFGNIILRPYPGTDIYDMLGRPSSGWDMVAAGLGSCPNVKSRDPYKALTSRLHSIAGGYGPLVGPKYQKKIRALRKLHGEARAKAAGKLDLRIMRNVAPVVMLGYFTGG
jgi:ABC-type transport system substrate-binding protein